MKHVLLTTDFSENSRHAIQYALNLFTYTPCHFQVLHVVKSSTYISDDLMQSDSFDSLYKDLIATAKKEVDVLISELKNSNNNLLHTFEARVDYDNLVASIKQLHEDQAVDLIVMGTKGASNFEKIVFGSQTLRVFQRCDVSVLAIPFESKFTPIKNVLFTTSYQSNYKFEDLKILIDLAEHYNYNLDILHLSDSVTLHENQEVVKGTLDSLFININKQFVRKPEANYLKTISNYISEHQIGLFTMMRKQHSFLEHLFLNHKTEQVANNLEIPFLMLAYKE
ncbi:universal stress protein [Bizionia sp. KMM 8389]